MRKASRFIGLILLFLWIGAAPLLLMAQYDDTSGSPMPAPRRIPQLAYWYAKLGVHHSQLIEQLAGPDLKIRPSVSYGRWRGLEYVYNDSIDGGSYYLADDAVVLVVVEGRQLCDSLNAQEFLETFSPFTSDEIMAGRTSKIASLYVSAEDGIAFCIADGKIESVELFHPMTLRRYLTKIYKTPPYLGL